MLRKMADKIIPPANIQNGGEYLKNALAMSGIILPHVVMLVSMPIENWYWRIAVSIIVLVILKMYMEGIRAERLRYQVMRKGEKYQGTILKEYKVKYYRDMNIYYYDIAYTRNGNLCQFRSLEMRESFYKRLSSANVDIYIFEDKALVYGFQRKKLFQKGIEFPLERLTYTEFNEKY